MTGTNMVSLMFFKFGWEENTKENNFAKTWFELYGFEASRAFAADVIKFFKKNSIYLVLITVFVHIPLSKLINCYKPYKESV